jgi:integrase
VAKVAVLADFSHRSGPVFLRHDGKPYEQNDNAYGGQIATAFNKACQRAGIKDFTPHDCRHTWATWLYVNTRDIRQLMELGGWSQISMVQRYVAVNPDHLRGAINTLPSGAASVQAEKQSG